MKKQKTEFVCNSCGGKHVKYLGKCNHCGEWNTIEEVKVEDEIKTNRYQSFTALTSKVEDLSDVKGLELSRKSSDMHELDRVLGNGFVDGSVVLLGGDPGVGKSTLLLQVAANLNKSQKVLYVSGEESSQQISLRANRMDLKTKGIKIYGEIQLEKIISKSKEESVDFLIIDSIQTLFSAELTSAPGTVTQVKECASQLNRYAKENNVTILMICHVTKDGELAGPRALEHIVDTVLYFEGDKNTPFRMIRAIKNRFGNVNEVGVFSMTANGLEEVTDPTGVFLNGNKKLPGASVYVTQEGNRSMLVEVQALLDETPLPNPIRRAIGIDLNRIQMLCAIIHKYVEFPIYQQNVFVSLVGGLKFSDTGVDVPAFLAMISSYTNKSLGENTASFGEIGLTGELKLVNNIEERIKEAARLGIKRIIIPRNNYKKIHELEQSLSIKIIQCENIKELIQAIS